MRQGINNGYRAQAHMAEFPKIGRVGRDWRILERPKPGALGESGYVCIDHLEWYLGFAEWDGRRIVRNPGVDTAKSASDFMAYLQKYSRVGMPRLVYDRSKGLNKELNFDDCRGKVMV